MKNTTLVSLEPATFVSLFATHLRHEDWRPTGKLAGFSSHAIELLAAHKPNTCGLLQGYGFNSSCSQIFFISKFNLGVANGAKVGLKLRLA